jgi:hypothetical protein
MPGFWTVLKWAAAVTLAPIVVWGAILLLLASVAVCNAPPEKPAARSTRHGAR